MAMTPTEMIEFYREQVKLFTRPLLDPAATSDYSHNALRFEAASWSQMMVALMRWRLNEGNPAPELGRTLTLAQEAAERLENLGPGQPHWKSYNFALGIFAGIILNSKAPSSLTQHLPDLTEFCNPTADTICPLLDAALCQSISSQEPVGAHQQLLDFTSDRERLRLLHDTYSLYFQLISEGRAGTSCQETVSQLDTLFSKRRSDEFFAGGIDTDGGGPDNDLVVDYRLAAIIRFASIPSVESKHCWTLSNA